MLYITQQAWYLYATPCRSNTVSANTKHGIIESVDHMPGIDMVVATMTILEMMVAAAAEHLII